MVILASESPRRKMILARILPRTSFKTVKSLIREASRPGEKPAAFAMRMALVKARRAAERIRLKSGQTAVVIGADTVIDLSGRIIGQPRDARHARSILRRLSGRRHSVITGMAFIRLPENKLARRSVRSSVWMKVLAPAVIDRYVKSGEPMDKAGAYGIQGRGKKLVRKYRGSYSNIVGFPRSEVRALLYRLCR
jgi:septum formation protein